MIVSDACTINVLYSHQNDDHKCVLHCQNDNSRWRHNLEHHSDDFRVVIYDYIVFIMQATGVFFAYIISTIPTWVHILD